MRRLALQTGMVDKPAERKIHVSPVPLLGGAAIYMAFVLVLLGDQRDDRPDTAHDRQAYAARRVRRSQMQSEAPSMTKTAPLV